MGNAIMLWNHISLNRSCEKGGFLCLPASDLSSQADDAVVSDKAGPEAVRDGDVRLRVATV